MAHRPAPPQRQPSARDAPSNDILEHSTATRSSAPTPRRMRSCISLRVQAVGLLASVLVASVDGEYRHHPDSSAYSLSPMPSLRAGSARSTKKPHSPCPTERRSGAGADLRNVAPSVARARSHKSEAGRTRTVNADSSAPTAPTISAPLRGTALTRSGDTVAPDATLGLEGQAARAVVCFDLDQTLSQRHTHKMAQRAKKTGGHVDFLDAFGLPPHLLSSRSAT